MKILVTGSQGMLGEALVQRLSPKFEVVGLDIVERKALRLKLKKFIQCDITDKERTVKEIVSARPQVVIHTAAYTNVDGCEQNPKKARQVNTQGTETVALACRKSESFLYYISTDYVFDGKKSSAYLESDEPHPINIYGKSKLEAERLIQDMLNDFIIVRSSWLFGKGGRNFVDVFLDKAQEGKSITVVNDQFGSPTYTSDLAEALVKLISLTQRLKGIFHITNSGSCSWYEFARAIQEEANLDIEIIPVSSQQYHSPAERPKMSILDNRRYQQANGEVLRPWQEALKEYLLR